MCRTTVAWKEAYYASPQWRAVRLQRLERDGWVCCHCRSTEWLVVHHWQYDLFNERMNHLTTLCGKCHEYVHDQVTLAFPKSIKQSIYEVLVPLEPTQ